MSSSEVAEKLRNAADEYAQASVDNALAARAGLDELQGTEMRMLQARKALDAAIDAAALTLAADMLEGLRQIRNMIDAPHFDEDRKCRVRGIASVLVQRAEALHMGERSPPD
jgi:hypothetical protein